MLSDAQFEELVGEALDDLPPFFQAQMSNIVVLVEKWPSPRLLREMDVPAFYQVPRLAYSREAATRNHYEYARWSEPVGQRLTWLLRQRIEGSRVFDSVATLGSGVLGDYQLNTRLVDFYHEASAPPGVVLLVLEAELIHRESARLIDHRLFVSQIPVARHDAAGAADAMGIAANQAIDEVILWLEQSAGK